MDHPCAPMPRMHRAVVAMATALLVLGEVSSAIAQQATPSPTAPKAQVKRPSTSLPAAPPATSQPAAPPATAQPQGADASQQFIFSPWAKICGKDGPEGGNGKEVCAVLTEARVPSGQIAVAVSLVQAQDGTPKILRVTLPLGVRLPFGTRIIIDQGTPLQSNYLMCLAGCSSDYEATTEMVDKLRKSQTLTVQAINPGGYPVSVSVPLTDFAKAYDGTPIDQKVLLERDKKLQGELERRAEETRNKLDGQPPPPAQSKDPFTAPAGK
jgi:invasion protein IalB